MPKNFPYIVDIGQGLTVQVGVPTIVSWNTANRPKKPKQGTFGYNFQTNHLEYWDGTVWWKGKMSEN